jgi:hypothetical protein
LDIRLSFNIKHKLLQAHLKAVNANATPKLLKELANRKFLTLCPPN